METTNTATQTQETEAKKTTARKNTKAASAPMRLFFRPVRADEIDVRVQNINNWKTTVLLYKDARVDQNILDETVGCYNWQKEYSRDNQNCTVSVWDEQKGQWISKEDTGTESNTEKEKGLASDSFKRACFCWGIGRELYTTPLVQIPTEFIELKEGKNGQKITYDKFYVDNIEVSVDDATGCKRISKLTVGIEHNGQRDWVWSWGGGNEIRTHKPAWCGKGTSQNASQNSNQQSNNAPAPQSNGNAWGNQNAPQQNAGQGGWNNSSGGQKGSFGHGSNANNGDSAPKRKWGAG